MNLKKQTIKDVQFIIKVDEQLKNPDFEDEEDKEFEQYYAVPNAVLNKLTLQSRASLLLKLRHEFGDADDQKLGDVASVIVSRDEISISEIIR